ncbi:MAG: hypothetical protein ABI644_14105 [Arenimonas sp.]
MRIILWCTLLATILAAYFYTSDANLAERVGSALIREKLSPEEMDAANYTKFQEEVEAKIDRIKAEVPKLKNHPWAGEYSGGMRGYLAISPNQGAAVISGPCIVMYGNRSSVHQNEKGWLELSPEKNEKFGYRAFDGALVPVHWGNRRYLIPEEDLQSFTTDINLGDEPRNASSSRAGMYYLAVGDEDKPVSVLPDLPADYLKKIRSVAVETNVSDVKLLKNHQYDYSCGREYRVTLDKGSADGLAKGDTLRLSNTGDSYERIDLLEVRNQSATALVFVAAKNCTDTSKSPNRSWKYTTGAYVAK